MPTLRDFDSIPYVGLLDYVINAKPGDRVGEAWDLADIEKFAPNSALDLSDVGPPNVLDYSNMPPVLPLEQPWERSQPVADADYLVELARTIQSDFGLAHMLAEGESDTFDAAEIPPEYRDWARLVAEERLKKGMPYSADRGYYNPKGLLEF